LYFSGKPDLPFGGWELFWWCQRLWQLIMGTRPKERAKKSEEKIEESGGNVRELWLNHDKKEWSSKGLSMSGLLGGPRGGGLGVGALSSLG
jgi:hypothetical protein